MGMSYGPAPTKAEQVRMDLIPECGCLACWQILLRKIVCEVHHLTVGGKHGAPRLGHAFTIGLCDWHHRGVGSGLRAEFGPSYAREPFAFRERFGRDDRLLVLQAERLAVVAATYLIRPVYV